MGDSILNPKVLVLDGLKSSFNSIIRAQEEITTLIGYINELETLPETLTVCQNVQWKARLKSKINYKITEYHEVIEDKLNAIVKPGLLDLQEIAEECSTLSSTFEEDFQMVNNYFRKAYTELTQNSKSPKLLPTLPMSYDENNSFNRMRSDLIVST